MKKHAGEVLSGRKLKEEYEVLLQNDSKFVMLEAQKFNGKTFMTLLRTVE